MIESKNCGRNYALQDLLFFPPTRSMVRGRYRQDHIKIRCCSISIEEDTSVDFDYFIKYAFKTSDDIDLFKQSINLTVK